MTRILITGSNGLIGRQLINSFSENAEVKLYGISSTENKNASGSFDFAKCDITDKARLCYELDRIKPDVIIHTAAIGSPDFCEDNKELAWNVNVKATESIAEYVRLNNVYLLHWSSDFIFDGLKGNYSEDDEAYPVNYYGLTKLESEKVVLSMCPDASVFRTILVYGLHTEMTRPNVLSRIIEANKQKKEMKVAADQYRMPTYLKDIQKAVQSAVKNKPKGIFHVSGNELLSVYEFVLKAAYVFELDTKLFVPVNSYDLKEKARRPVKTGFMLDKVKTELNYYPSSVLEAFKEIKQSFIP